MKKLVFLIFVLSVNYCLAGDFDSAKVYVFDPLVVTGARYEIEKSKIPYSLTVVTNEQISDSRETNVLPVLSQNVPGLFLSEKGVAGYGVSNPAAGKISMRGISGDPNTNVLVLIDGQPQFMGLFGHPIADSYFSSDIERVEVIRGPASVLYGSNAMGGAINFITSGSKERKNKVRIGTEQGSYNTRVFNGMSKIYFGKLNINASMNYSSTDGHRSDADDRFNSTGGFLSAGYEFNPEFNIDLQASLSSNKFYDPGTIEKPLNNAEYKYLRGRYALSLNNNFGDVYGSLRAFYNFGDHKFYDGWNSDDVNTGITFYQNYRAGESIFTFGTDYKYYGGDAEYFMMGKNNYKKFHSNETEFYASANITPVKNLNTDAGIRYTYSSIFGGFFTPQAGISYRFSPDYTVKTRISKGFRSPTIIDLYFFPVANEKLNPENVVNFEIGADAKLLGNMLFGSLTFFTVNGYDMIQSVRNPALAKMQKINSGRLNNKGVEASLDFYPAEDLNFNVNYAFTDKKYDAKYAPKHQLNISAGYAYSILRGNVNLKHVNGLTTDLASKKKTRYTVVDVLLNAQVAGPVNIYLKLNNILNWKYEIDAGYRLPKFNFMAGVSFDI